MSGFISRAACRGRRPSQFSALQLRERPALLSRLLENRDVARFLVAPCGYGKTSLALMYAETMFSWSHVFWVNAQSPCFIRDLDKCSIADACLAADEKIALVVFDDLPALSPERTQRLSREIDELLASECEVLAACVPTCDMIGKLQQDRIRIRALDLLLDDEELDATRTSDERAVRPVESIGAARRIPALAWDSSSDACLQFAKSVLYEEMPADLLLASGSCLALGRGTISDLLALGPIDGDMLKEIIDDYPHLGLDGDFEAFEAPHIPVEALAAPMKRRLADMTARSSYESPTKLVWAWADLLVSSHRATRACDVIRDICPNAKRLAWAETHAWDAVRQTAIFSLLRLATTKETARSELRMRMGALEALCRGILGDGKGAVACAKRYAFNELVPQDVRICSLLVLARFGSGHLQDLANETLADVAKPETGEPLSDLQSKWSMLATAWSARIQSPLDLAQLWVSYLEHDADSDVLCVCASWLFSSLGAQDKSVPAIAHAVNLCERYIRDQLLADETGQPDYFIASAGLALEHAHSRGLPLSLGPLPASALVKLRRVEMSILAERSTYESFEKLAASHGDDWALTHPSSAMAARKATSLAQKSTLEIPVLTLKMIGCFDVYIGNTLIDPKRFYRKNARSLLVLLAVNQGRELSRASIAHSMWPTKSEDDARKNFYTVWSQLRSAISLPDGSCPYLIRQQFGCRLEMRYVNSDIDRFDQICRELLFGAPDIERWAALFAEIDQDFSSDLMPADTKNALVAQARNDLRTRLIDALVAATLRIIETDSPEWGIWFARAALKHDDTREDAYFALMKAQIASNQRTAAMMTFIQCRRVLSDKLGIDPSPEIVHLYEDLLEIG